MADANAKDARFPIAFARPFLGAAEERAVAEVVRSGWVVGGERLAELERRFAEQSGTSDAVGVSSWTTGAFLVLHAWGIGPGDEVVVPSLTFIATVNVIRHVGATPVFADVDALTFNVDPSDIARKINSRTRVLMPVDQLGLPCDIDATAELARRHGLRLLDDAACAFGSRNHGRPVGSLAEVTAFSLHARKVVTAGEGGIIVTNDRDFAERLRRLRHQGMSLSDHARHGMRPTVYEAYPEIGYNYRITDLQAAIALPQLDRLEDILMRRRNIARRYTEALTNHPLLVAPHVPTGMEPNWQSYQVALRPEIAHRRDEIMDWLFDRGIPTRRGVMASHFEAPYSEMNARLPVTEAVAKSTLQLPMHPGLTPDQQEYIVATLRDLAQ
jgi:perosamine synthetase